MSGAPPVSITQLVTRYRHGELKRLLPLIAQYPADEITDELWGLTFAEAQAASPDQLRFDWRSRAAGLQRQRLGASAYSHHYAAISNAIFRAKQRLVPS